VTTFTLVGVDPGIRDTAVVAIRLRPEDRNWAIRYRVWSDVTHRVKQEVIIDQKFLRELTDFQQNEFFLGDAVLTGVEGYRQRGRNIMQDQAMLMMIRETSSVLDRSTIVDNTGIKNVVTEPLLKLFQVSRFSTPTNHADLKSAARVALKIGIANPEINTILSDFVRDNLGDKPWARTSM